MNNISRYLTLTALFTLGFAFALNAQVPPVGSTNTPIDGGVIALLLGSAYFGYKKIKADKNKGE